MNHSTSTSILDRSRLLALLSELSVARLHVAEYNVAESLGRSVKLDDLRFLSSALNNLPTTALAKTEEMADAHSLLFSTREECIRRILSSFSDRAGADTIPLPTSLESIKPQALLSFDPYRRFYTAHQTEMTGAIVKAQSKVRILLATQSANLHQLALVDHLLDNAMSPLKRSLDLVPMVLDQQFKLLSESNSANEILNGEVPASWLADEGWIPKLYRQMRLCLLAELDLRMEPIVGLVESLQE